jgi:hypothetical protein
MAVNFIGFGQTDYNLRLKRDTTYIRKLNATTVYSLGNIRVFDVTNVSGVVIDSTGTSRFGSARQWNDVGSFKLSTYKSAGTPETPVDGAPSYSPKGNGFSGMQFLVDDSASGEEEILHEFVENDSSDLHMHYETGSMDNTSRYLRFEAFVGYKKPGDSLFTVSHRDTLEDTIPASTGKLWYRVRSFGKHATPGITIGSMYCLKVRRITATGTAPSAGPFIMNISIHRRVDSDGSRGVYTK